MSFLYTAFVYSYGLAIRLVSLFNAKAALWIKGRRNWHTILVSKREKGAKYIWVHCASLGEFEQGRPVIEKFKNEYPGYRIALTFFSPSGYEIRKNYELADIISYLPLDTPSNAASFVSALQPEMAIFVKYEFWYHHLKAIHDRHIPLFLISAHFKPGQVFFSWYGRFFRKTLSFFSYIFVQEEQSKKLLATIGVNNVAIAGDTRFDRVFEIKQKIKELPFFRELRSGLRVLVAGSTWPPDEELLLKFIKQNPHIKCVIAPHEIGELHVKAIIRQGEELGLSLKRYSEVNAREAAVIIIDSIGLLSSLYAYADIAYIGGGFGKGIHNVLEAAVYEIPVFFGPHYERFNEAVQLVKRGGAGVVKSLDDLGEINALLNNAKALEETGTVIKDFMQESRGATERIFQYLKPLLKGIDVKAKL